MYLVYYECFIGDPYTSLSQGKPAVLELKREGKNFFWYEGTAEGCDIARDFLKANQSYL